MSFIFGGNMTVMLVNQKSFMPIMIMLEKYYTFYIQFLKINQLFILKKTSAPLGAWK